MSSIPDEYLEIINKIKNEQVERYKERARSITHHKIENTKILQIFGKVVKYNKHDYKLNDLEDLDILWFLERRGMFERIFVGGNETKTYNIDIYLEIFYDPIKVIDIQITSYVYLRNRPHKKGGELYDC